MSPVYSRGPIMGARPIFLVTAAERREMIANGSAKPINRGKAIQLLLNLEQFRGQSAQMGPSVTLRAAGVMGTHGSMKFSRSIAESWMTPGYNCPLIPIAATI